MKRIITFWFIVIILTGGIIIFGNTDIPANAVKTEHIDPIHIDGNLGFNETNGVSSGDGSISNPYIIENWDIDASVSHGIYIENTNVYFVIKNCVIHDGKDNYNGVCLYNVTTDLRADNASFE